MDDLSENGHTLELMLRLHAAHEQWDQRAIDTESRVLHVGYVLAVLAPLAVLLLAIQTVFFTACAQRAVACGLIAAELLILAVALCSLFANLLPSSHEWAGCRLRAELLRREEFLLLVRLGPYLEAATGARLTAAVQARQAQLVNEAVPPADLLHPHSPPGADWRDQLEDVPMERQALPDAAALHDYLERRIDDQQHWFQKQGLAMARKHGLFENVAKTVLLLAGVTAAMHLTALIYCEPDQHSFASRLVEILALVLPPIGAAIASLEAFLQCHRLSYSYRDHARVLEELGAEMRDLLAQLAGPGGARQPAGLPWKQAKRLALRCEELLTRELRQWYFVIRPEKPPIH